MVAIRRLGIKHVVEEVIFELFPTLRGTRIGLALFDEPVVPAASKGKAFSFVSGCPSPFFLARTDARFNLGFPLSEARLCLVARCARR